MNPLEPEAHGFDEHNEAGGSSRSSSLPLPSFTSVTHVTPLGLSPVLSLSSFLFQIPSLLSLSLSIPPPQAPLSLLSLSLSIPPPQAPLSPHCGLADTCFPGAAPEMFDFWGYGRSSSLTGGAPRYGQIFCLRPSGCVRDVIQRPMDQNKHFRCQPLA